MTTASELRANLYKILDQVIETGIPVEIRRKGGTVKIIPTASPSKLARLVKREEFIVGDPNDIIHLDWSGEWRP